MSRDDPTSDSPTSLGYRSSPGSAAGALTAHRSPRRFRILGPIGIEGFIVVVLSALVGVAATWPLAAHISTKTFDRFDAPLHGWLLDWGPWSLEHGRWPADANIFFPSKNTWATLDSQLLVGLILRPIHWLGGGPAVVANMAIIGAWVSAGAGGYLLGRVVFRSPAAAAMTAAGFALGPFSSFVASHPHISWRAPMASALAGAWLLAEEDEPSNAPSRVGILLVGGSVAAAGLTGLYLTAMTLVVLLVVFVARFEHLRSRWAALALSSLAGLAISGPIMWGHIRLAGSGAVAEFGTSGGSLLAARWWSSARDNRVWGGVMGPSSDVASAFSVPAFPGLVLLVTAAVGLWWARRQQPAVFRIAIGLLASGFVLGLGADSTGWRRFTPLSLLTQVVPFAGSLRATGRFWLIGQLGLALAAGCVVIALTRWLTERFGEARAVRPALGLTVWGLVAVLSLMMFIEGLRIWTPVSMQVRTVDRELATRAPGPVVYLPLNKSETSVDFPDGVQSSVVFRSTEHHLPIVNGYSGATPKEFVTISKELRALPEAGAVDRLKDLGVRYVVVGPEVLGTPWAAMAGPSDKPGLHLVGDFDGDVLYEIE